MTGVGTETVGTDAGQAAAQDPMFPCHNLMHGAQQMRTGQSVQFGSIAPNRCHSDCGTTENSKWLWQPLPSHCVGADGGLSQVNNAQILGEDRAYGGTLLRRRSEETPGG